MIANTHDDRIAVPISEACRISGIGRSKLYDVIKSGDVRIAKIGRRSLVLVESLRTLLSARAA
jgi:Helix-turn-helix domain